MNEWSFCFVLNENPHCKQIGAIHRRTGPANLKPNLLIKNHEPFLSELSGYVWGIIGGGQTCNNKRATSICPVFFYYFSFLLFCSP